MAQVIDLSGNDLIIGSVYAGASTAGSSGTALAGSELTVLDSVTPGTAAANKAVVLGASKEIATITTATITNLTTTTGTITTLGTTTLTPTTIAGAANFTGTPTFASLSASGVLTTRSGTATPAAASAVKALAFGTAGVGLYWGTGSPNTALTAPKGSLYLTTDGSSSTTRAYINTDGSTAWTAVSTVA